MKAFNDLEPNEKSLVQQVAANPAFMKILYIQKIDCEKELINFYSRENEIDSSFRRRHEILRLKHTQAIEFIEILESLLK